MRKRIRLTRSVILLAVTLLGLPLLAYAAPETGRGGGANPTDTNLQLTDVTTNNASVTKHGFLPKLPNNANVWLNGVGTFTTPPVAGISGLTPGVIQKALTSSTLGDSSLLDCGGGVVAIGACSGNGFSFSGVATAPRAITLPDAASATVVAKDCNVLSAGDVVKSISAAGVIDCLTPSSISSLTTGKIPKATSATTIGDSGLSEGAGNLMYGSGAFAQNFEVAALTADRTFHLPNANSVSVQPDAGTANNFFTAISAEGVISKSTVAALAANATATTPVVTTGLKDANSNLLLSFNPTATAVDYLEMTNGATANPAAVFLTAKGSDSNIHLRLGAVGTGGVFFGKQGSAYSAYWDETNQLLGIGSKTFSGLGTPANGQFAYCSDCTIANPCAGSGSGAFAKRLNGVWVCN